MTFIKKQNNYILIFVLLTNVSCVYDIPVNSLKHSGKNESLVIQKDEKALNRNCDLIWNIRHENQKEIFFRNTCTSQSCMVMWKSKNILGIWSPLHYDYILPKEELSYPIPFYDMYFEVDYYFQ